MALDLVNRSKANGLLGFWLLFSYNMLQLRLTWFWYLFMMGFNGVTFIVFLWLLGTDSVLFILTGSMTMTLVTASALSLGQNIGMLKDIGAFEYFATLPISRCSFILALAIRSLFFAVPSLILTLVFGVFLFDLSLNPHVLLLPTTILGGLSLVGLGALIGFYSPTGMVASWVTQVIHPIITFLAPVYIPVETLPTLLEKTSVIFPTTYIARALRATLVSDISGLVYHDLGMMGLWVMLSFFLVLPRLDWRGRDK